MYGPLVRTVCICYAVAVVLLKNWHVYKVFLTASILSENVSIKFSKSFVFYLYEIRKLEFLLEGKILNDFSVMRRISCAQCYKCFVLLLIWTNDIFKFS